MPLDKWFNSWLDDCGVRTWTWWSSWVPPNSGYSMIPWEGHGWLLPSLSVSGPRKPDSFLTVLGVASNKSIPQLLSLLLAFSNPISVGGEAHNRTTWVSVMPSGYPSPKLPFSLAATNGSCRGNYNGKLKGLSQGDQSSHCASCKHQQDENFFI